MSKPLSKKAKRVIKACAIAASILIAPFVAVGCIYLFEGWALLAFAVLGLGFIAFLVGMGEYARMEREEQGQ